MQPFTTKRSILLYNIEDKSYEKKLKLLCIRLGIKLKPVSPAEYGLPLSSLLENKTETLPEATESFTAPMVVFHGFNNQHLDQLLRELKKASIRIDLKAVVTPHNISWTSLALYQELSLEHQKMQELKEQGGIDAITSSLHES